MLAAAQLASAGCADEETESAGGEVTSDAVAGSLVWALPERPATLDPLFARSESEQLVGRQIHEPLVAELTGPFEDVRRLPGLALSAQPSSDQTVWRLRLRKGVRFQDGSPFNATAVLANFERWSATAEGRALIGGALADAPRPDLVRFILAAPDRRFDRRLAAPALGVVSPRALASAGAAELDVDQAARSGTGPFELRERAADRMLLAHNSDWWGTRRELGPALDQLEFTVVADPAERLRLLADGSVQAAGGLGPDELAEVRADPLLTTLGGGLGVERSVRGIPPGEPAPPLNGAWRTAIDAGG